MLASSDRSDMSLSLVSHHLISRGQLLEEIVTERSKESAEAEGSSDLLLIIIISMRFVIPTSQCGVFTVVHDPCSTRELHTISFTHTKYRRTCDVN